MSHVTGRKLANRDKQHDNNSEADETLMIDEDIKDDLPLSKAKRLYISQDKNQQIYKQNYYESEVEEVIDTDDNSDGKSNCKGLILFHILISSQFLLLASIFEFQCFGLFSGLTCPKFMGLEPLCYSYFCAFLGLLSVT